MTANGKQSIWTVETMGKQLVWDWERDEAVLKTAEKSTAAAADENGDGGSTTGNENATADGSVDGMNGPVRPAVVWSGGLLPAFELAIGDGKGAPLYAKAAVTAAERRGDRGIALTLDIAGHGTGTLACEAEDWGLRFSSLEIEWFADTRIVSLQFGSRALTPLEQTRTPRLGCVHWPNWAAEGYCVPAAGSSPTHSFFRSWDMGDARLPLGSFGDAMGTPYAAAFPRPLYAAAMGGSHGWLAFGPGEVPDAPLTLQLQSATASLHFSYREDLWTPAHPRKRVWLEPLRLAWGDSGYEALQRLYASFGSLDRKSPHHLRSFLCTWGDFKEGRFDLKKYADRIASSTPADMVIIDDLWETYNGSGEPNLQRFPDFEADLAGLRERGYEIALWQSLGWVDSPSEAGLTDEDLLCGPDGLPRQWRWSGSPLAEGGYHYLADPSSERVRRLIVERTQRIVRRFKPAALKLDFGYGYPGPDACVPRDPAYRGERLAYSLLKLAYDAAKEIDPSITIIYYGIHPLLHYVIDLINLDDLGDAGDSAAHELSGHNQRCLWASLAASHGMAVNTSTGYYWDTLGSILLDTAVVGVNGLTLGEFDNDGKRMTALDGHHWAALQAWHRRVCGWKPLLLEGGLGSLKSEPRLVSWARVETAADGADMLVSLALRDSGAVSAGAQRDTGAMHSYAAAPFARFNGDWAVLSLDEAYGIAEAGEIACVPFSAGELELDGSFSSVEVYGSERGRLKLLRTIDRTGEQTPLRLSLSEDERASVAGFMIKRS